MPASQHQKPLSDIEIAQAAKPRRIVDVAKEKLGIAPENLEPYGHTKAKLSMDFIKALKSKKDGKLIRRGRIDPVTSQDAAAPSSVPENRPTRQNVSGAPLEKASACRTHIFTTLGLRWKDDYGVKGRRSASGVRGLSIAAQP